MSYKLIFILVVILLGIAATVYVNLTAISFSNNHASISSFYCTMSSQKDKLTTPVIFIPGIKGSILKQNGSTVWFTLSQLLPGGTPFLYDPATESTIVPSGIVTRLVIIPLLAEYRPYYAISAALACQPNTYFFSYDWRIDPATNVAKLGLLVDRVRQETGQKPSIIAHSMGGLIAHAYMKENGDNIGKVVYAGVPFWPGTSFVDDLDNGSSNGLNKTIMSKEAVFSYPSSFVLLPHAGQHLYKGQDLMQATTWQTNRLSVFKDSPPDVAVFQKTLDRAAAFQKILDTPAILGNNFLFIIGNCQSTPQSVATNGSVTTAAGDGRVVATGALPVELLSDAQTFNSCATHDQQLNDAAVIQKIFSFLNPEQK